MNRNLQIGLFIVTGIIAFLFFVILFLPLDTIVSHYLANLEKQNKGQYRVSVGKMDTSLLFDSEFEDFRFEQKEGEGYVELFYAPRIKVGVSLIALLSQRLNLHFTSYFKKGELSGYVALADGENLLDLNFKRLGIHQLSYLSNLLKKQNLGFQIEGVIDGNFYFSENRSANQTESTFDLKIYDFKLKDFSTVISGNNIYFSSIVLSPDDTFAKLQGDFSKNTARINSFSIPGPDIDMQLDGSLRLSSKYQITRSRLKGRFAFSDKIMEKIPELTMLDDYKTPEGFYPLRISGSFRRMPNIQIGRLNLTDMLKSFGIVK